MVITRVDRPMVFDQPAHIARESHVWNALSPYLPNLQNKSVLDLGCGWGGFGKRAAEQGAKVLFVDGREDNLRVAKEAGPNHSYIHQDITDPFWSPPLVDVTLCLGVLYHVDNPKDVLRKVASSPVLAIESICLDHDGVAMVMLQEDTEQVDYSLTGGACRPSPGWIVQALYDIGYNSITAIGVTNIAATPEWPGALWDWDYEHTCGWRRNGHQLRKLYIATK